MQDVAEAVGIRAPSLYGRFKDRASLLGAIELQVCAELARKLGQLISEGDPEATLKAQAQALRRFAKRNPNSYSLLFDRGSVHTEEGTSARAAAVAPLLPPLAALAGKDHAFAAARVLVPFVHGFISMELADQFRLGGGLDAAFENGVTVVLRGIRRSAQG